MNFTFDFLKFGLEFLGHRSGRSSQDTPTSGRAQLGGAREAGVPGPARPHAAMRSLPSHITSSGRVASPCVKRAARTGGGVCGRRLASRRGDGADPSGSRSLVTPVHAFSRPRLPAGSSCRVRDLRLTRVNREARRPRRRENLQTRRGCRVQVTAAKLLEGASRCLR